VRPSKEAATISGTHRGEDKARAGDDHEQAEVSNGSVDLVEPVEVVAKHQDRRHGDDAVDKPVRRYGQQPIPRGALAV
jgi:hypothetical protein